MGLRCQQVYLSGRSRCRHYTYGDSEFCRWHKILNEFCQDHYRLKESRNYEEKVKKKIESYYNFIQICVLANLAITGFSLWIFFGEPHIIWLLLSIYLLGGAFKLFADSIIAVDYPLSQFAFWAKLLSLGIVLEIIGGASFSVLAASPKISQIITNTINSLLSKSGVTVNSSLLTLGVVIFAVFFIARNAAEMWSMFVKRILFWRISEEKSWLLPPSGIIEFLFPYGVLLWAIFQHLATIIPVDLSTIQKEVGKNFWEPVLGESIGITLVIAWLLTFQVAEMINVRKRRFLLSTEEFKATYWPSFFACQYPSIIAMFVSRYLLFWIGMRGAIPYVVLSVIVTIPLCLLSTSWVIRQEVRKRNSID